MKIKTIYIKLLEAGTDVWVPTAGKELGENTFFILPVYGYDPEFDERWEFPPGSIVHCEEMLKHGSEGLHKILVATNLFEK